MQMSLDAEDRFVEVDLPPGRWDLSQLDRTGEITLEAMLQPGDADGSGQFNQIDLVQVLIAAQYLTGQPATWAEGDFNGDGRFDQLDIVLTLQTQVWA